jgi:hypothetical protein
MLQNRLTSPVEPSVAPAAAATAVAPAPRRSLLQWKFILPAIVLGLFGAERYASEPYKPSTISGGLLGHEENVRLRTQLEATQATVAAQNEENARMQQQVERFRAGTERVTEAYRVLFQRAAVMQQAMAQTEQQFMVLRQQMAKEMERGNVEMAGAADVLSNLLKPFGDQAKPYAAMADQMGKEARTKAMAGFDGEMGRTLTNSRSVFSNWQDGLPDIARIDQVVQQDRIDPLQPAPRPAPPLPPPAYQTQPAQSPPSPSYRSAAATPAVSASTMLTPIQASAPGVNSAETEGAAAFREWDAWINGQTGNRRAGADWWSANRNVPRHVSCTEGARRKIADPPARQEFEAGCLGAKQRTDPTDNRRNAEYDFNKGFNVAAGGSPPPVLTDAQKQWCAAHDLVIIACNSHFKPK